MLAIKNYTAHLDAKKRLTLRGAKYEYYDVKEYENGSIVLEPRELVAPIDIPSDVLDQIDHSMENYRKGKVYGPLDLSAFED
ncbi:MAG: hypothetical protein IJT82_08400 [Schwartzia sp.]|nr:hypothetical protein [Schwartzia sp. (in: firmicutes)]